MDYKIRLARVEDCTELSKLKHDTWNETYRGIYSDEKIDNYDYEKNKKKFIDLINNPGIKLYVVEVNNKIVGYMDYGTPIRSFKDYKQEIGLLYLLKEYQRNGIGKELFNLASSKIFDSGYNEFFISCNKYNQNAIDFYTKMGGELVEIDEDEEDKSYPQVKFLYRKKVK